MASSSSTKISLCGLEPASIPAWSWVGASFPPGVSIPSRILFVPLSEPSSAAALSPSDGFGKAIFASAIRSSASTSSDFDMK